jgi:hypothetical protein
MKFETLAQCLIESNRVEEALVPVGRRAEPGQIGYIYHKGTHSTKNIGRYIYALDAGAKAWSKGMKGLYHIGSNIGPEKPVVKIDLKSETIAFMSEKGKENDTPEFDRPFKFDRLIIQDEEFYKNQ